MPAILDFFDFHLIINNNEPTVSTQNASLMSRFIDMLENGDYLHNREVTYYADALYVSKDHDIAVCTPGLYLVA